jgi:putative transposase
MDSFDPRAPRGARRHLPRYPTYHRCFDPSILEGIEEILTVTRLGLPDQLRRSLACTNMIENVMGTVRRVCRNVKRWHSSSMAMHWTAAAMDEASKGFRRLKADKQLPLLRKALLERQAKFALSNRVAQTAEAA